ncbi:MAG: maltokinase N-terminal cap-like domain-containing protein [Leptospirales bacterium]
MTEGVALPVLNLWCSWSELSHVDPTGDLARVLEAYLPRCRWFGSKSREIRSTKVESVHRIGPVPSEIMDGTGPFFLCVLLVAFGDGVTERYLFPLARVSSGRVEAKARIARMESVGHEPDALELVDGLYLPEMGRALLSLFGPSGEPAVDAMGILTTEAFEGLGRSYDPAVDPVLFRGEQSNSSLLFGGAFMLKCFRRLEPGVNLDLEVGMFLEDDTLPRIVAPLGGAILGKTPEGEPLTFAMLQGFVANRGDGWSWMRDTLKKGVLDSDHEETIASGPYGEKLMRMVARIGTRTAELHQSLARDPHDPDFAPSLLTRTDVDDLVRSVGLRLEKTFELLRRNLERMAPGPRSEGSGLLERLPDFRGMIGRVHARESGDGYKIRCHGDFHLGQLLVTPEEDVVFLDFEGEPALSLAERRQKSSPLLDVAGMIRSLHYLSCSVLGDPPNPDEVSKTHRWFIEASALFLSAYFQRMEGGRPLLSDRERMDPLLTLYLLRKGLYELEYELNNRPDWVGIPLAGLLNLLEK